jgi:hypothetical protein
MAPTSAIHSTTARTIASSCNTASSSVRSSLIFLLLTVLTSSQLLFAQVNPSERSDLCRLDSIPFFIRNYLNKEFSSWRVQEPANLKTYARKRWDYEKPLACPGVAFGQFENREARVYAVLLVPAERLARGYRLLVFSRNGSQSRPSYKAIVLDQSETADPGNFLIRSIRIADYFDKRSATKFRVQGKDGILFVDSAEDEYEVDVYYWADGQFRSDPVDR